MLQKKLDDITEKLCMYGGIVDETSNFNDLNDNVEFFDQMRSLLKERHLKYGHENCYIIIVEYRTIYEANILVDTAKKVFGVYNFINDITYPQIFRNIVRLGVAIDACEIENTTIFNLENGEITYYHVDYDLYSEYGRKVIPELESFMVG